ncbi:hypothetical protein ACIRSU_01595 [Streptomyces sp. NPDC101160]|uniref:hypothetical protein n=1 Tax=Streptomyces sp. NPDC101160 TaxID=3366118 RepID=UPI003825D3FB
MRGRDSWQRRTSKGLLCASASLFLGAVGHVAAGGSLPGARGLGIVFTGLTVLGAVLFGGRRRHFDVTVLTLGVTQFALHLVFHRMTMMPADGSGHGAMAGRHHHGAGMTMPAHMTMPADMAMPTDTGAADSGPDMTAAMTSGHALATLGTALCLIYGERILRRLAALLLPRLPLLAPTVSCPAPPAGRPPAPFTAGHVRLGVLLTRCRPRRGPPPVIPA